jgi:peptidoglycan/xylan/chitin deacetylase (PgdA/CDA1 family)
MRAAIAIGGLLVAGCLGAYGAVEAQRFPIANKIASTITSTIRSALGDESTTTSASAAPVEAPPMRPQAPRAVVTEIPVQSVTPQAAPAPATQAASAPTTALAPQAAAAPQPAPAPQVSPAPQAAPTLQAAPKPAPAPAIQIAAAQNPPVPQTAPAPQPAAPAAPAPAAHAGPAPIPMPLPPPINCNNPNALGVSRIVQIDTTGGPGFGLEHFRDHDFLNDHEVVLTFDDGPWLNHTPAVLKALADQCTRATFFAIGLHATYYPEILKQVAAAGHTIGSHTWSHKDLSKLTPDEAKDEIEKGASAVHWAAGVPIAPFFRFPALRHPPEMVTYLGQRNIAIFSCDFDSFDFKMHRPDQVVKSVMEKLAKHGKGIILMHDFKKATSEALPEILAKLKAGGYKIVQMVPKDQLQTLPQYDEAILKDEKLPTVSQQPTSSIVHTITQ